LFEIFDLCRKDHYNNLRPLPVWKWHILVHVCKRWRQLVLSSPHRLDLQILCTFGTPFREDLSIWPAFPIVLDLYSPGFPFTPNDEDNAIAALEHSDRLCSISLYVTGSMWAKMATVLRKPFPLLKRITFFTVGLNVPTLPDVFLGGSVPRLQEFYLNGIPFPALPALLLTTSNLVNLTLSTIPPTGYISPETMVACLDVLPLLERFVIEFCETDPHPDQIRPPPTTRSALPALTSFSFQGPFEYLEDFVTQVDGPQLDQIVIGYLNGPDDSQVAQLSEFINRSVSPESTPSGRAHVTFHYECVAFTLYRRADYPGWDQRPFKTTISSDRLEWLIPDLADVLSQFSATFSTVVHLKVEVQPDEDCLEAARGADWLRFFRQLPAMQILDVSGQLAEPVAIALKRITTETVSGVFPSLHLIFIEDQPVSSVETIVAARRHSDRPVTFVETKAEFDKILKFDATVSE
jgi:hypothetical protein